MLCNKAKICSEEACTHKELHAFNYDGYPFDNNLKTNFAVGSCFDPKCSGMKDVRCVVVLNEQTKEAYEKCLAEYAARRCSGAESI